MLARTLMRRAAARLGRMAPASPSCSASQHAHYHRGAGAGTAQPRHGAPAAGRAKRGKAAGAVDGLFAGAAAGGRARGRRGHIQARAFSSDGSTAGTGNCPVDQAYEMLLLDGTHIYIDCRSESEWRDGHPTSSANIPYPNSDAGTPPRPLPSPVGSHKRASFRERRRARASRPRAFVRAGGSVPGRAPVRLTPLDPRPSARTTIRGRRPVGVRRGRELARRRQGHAHPRRLQERRALAGRDPGAPGGRLQEPLQRRRRLPRVGRGGPPAREGELMGRPSSGA